MPDIMLFSGNANLPLAQEISKDLSMPLGKSIIKTFSDGEIRVEILENVRGKDVFIIQPTSYPTNNNLMELILMADAIRRASAARVTAVIPYFGYARQDRRINSNRVPISAKVIANLLSTVNINRILTVDLHSEQIQGFFDIPVDNLYAAKTLVDDLKNLHLSNIMIISPDIGGVARARALAQSFNNNDLAIIDKRRPCANKAEVINIIGNVKGRDCVIIDDMIDTAGTICKAAEFLKLHGANSVRAYCTHPVLSGKAFDNIHDSCLDELVITNSIELPLENIKNSSKIDKITDKVRQLSLSPLISQAVVRINQEKSISCMFSQNTVESHL